jgi:hypothetical protein
VGGGFTEKRDAMNTSARRALLALSTVIIERFTGRAGRRVRDCGLKTCTTFIDALEKSDS